MVDSEELLNFLEKEKTKEQIEKKFDAFKWKRIKKEIKQLQKKNLVKSYNKNSTIYYEKKGKELTEKIDEHFFKSTDFNKIFVIAVSILIMVSLLITLNHTLITNIDEDEVEHLHSAWYVFQGYSPYKDFFEHHPPLLWFLLAPFYLIFGETSTALLSAKIFLWFFGAGTVLLTFMFARRLFDEKIAILSSFLVSINYYFVVAGFSIRPDTPALFFLMAAIYFLQIYKEEQDFSHLFLCGTLFSVSFLFTTKTAFFFIIPILLVYFLERKNKESDAKNQNKKYTVFIVSLLIPALLVAGIGLHDSFNEFIFLNGTFNFELQEGLKSGFIENFDILYNDYIGAVFYSNILFIFLSLIGFFWMALKNFKKYFVLLFSIIILIFIYLFFIRMLGHSYVIPFIPFFSIATVVGLNLIGKELSQIKIPFAKAFPNIILILFVLFQIFLLPSALSFIPVGDKIISINEYVLENSDKNDVVFTFLQPTIVFREDVAYNWFCMECAYKVFPRLGLYPIGPVFLDDAIAAKPKYIFIPEHRFEQQGKAFVSDPEKYGYKRTPFKELFELKED